MAIHFLRDDRIRKIILCRPAVEAGEKLGFLPGDFQAKINPYLRPLYDALNDLLDYDQVKRYLEREIIEILPLAYMRGRTLNNAFIILDEGQNTSVAQMKMFLTRMGMNSRIVVNGDVTQVDLPQGQLSGLIHAQRIITHIPGISWIQLQKADIVRHPIVKRIVEAYEKAETRAGKSR
jgi:phosphate starvation-inducible PhoH-like protein